MRADNSYAEARTPNGLPLAVQQRSITIPSGVVSSGIILGRGDEPLKSAILREGRNLDFDSKEPVQRQVSPPLLGQS